jgi:hypothetical protein
MGFTILSLVKRLPIIIAPVIGGYLITRFGIPSGLRTGLAITIGLTGLTVFIVLAVNLPITKGKRPTFGVFGIHFIVN